MPQGMLNSPSPLPPLPQSPRNLAVPGKPLNTVVQTVNHQQVIVVVKGDACGPVKLTFSFALDTPFVEESPSAIEDRNTVESLV